MPSFKAILFDLDGTLVSSEHLHLEAWDEMLKKQGLHFDEEWFRNWIGVSDASMAEQIAAKYPLGMPWQDFLEAKRALFQRKAAGSIVPLAGVKDGLEAFFPFPMAVVTMSNLSDAMLSLESAGLLSFFKTIVTADDVTNPKPDAEAYLTAAKRLGVAPADCLAVEDSISGVGSAKAAGCYTIGVANSIDGEKLSMADEVFSDTEEAMAYIKQTLFIG
jgi:beta-phosphoglucomutase-like phosphatase (HAD superfamily)